MTTLFRFGYEDRLASLISQACIQVLPRTGPLPSSFNVDNVRVTKILGGGVTDTKLVKGFVLPRDVEGTIKHVQNAKIAVFVSGIGTNQLILLRTYLQQCKKISTHASSQSNHRLCH